jgi:hypothetical protein
VDAHAVTFTWLAMHGLRILAFGHVEAHALFLQPLGDFAQELPATPLPFKNIKAYLPDG